MEDRCFICGKLGSEMSNTNRRLVPRNRACRYFLNRAAQPRIYEICLKDEPHIHHEPVDGSIVCQKHDIRILRKSPAIRFLPAGEEFEDFPPDVGGIWKNFYNFQN